MQLEHALLGVVLHQSNEGIHMVNRDGITKYYNTAAAIMDGLDPSEVLEKHVLEAFPSLNRDTSTLLQVARTGKPMVDQQQVYTNVKGAEIATINTTLPVFGQDGQLLGAVEMARDISQIRRLAEQVTDLRRKLYMVAPQPPVRQTASYTFSDIIGSSRKLCDVLAKAALAAHTDSPIMVVGETGTGKELLVQAVHNSSLRSAKPFVAQNCAALPEGILDAILFGSVRGSFTGAQDRPGLFELANGGTLFLDELNAMPSQLQAKLLRVLETGELRRLGDTRTRRVDTRIIAAMSANPRDELRQDLYYRLNVVTFSLPPLRERMDDIPILCRHFLGKFNAKLGTRISGISANAETLLKAWPWPGNIRELSNLIEGILNLKSVGVIEADDLPEQIKSLSARTCWDLRQELNRLEAIMVNKAMSMAGGNISEASRLLNIPRQTLQRKLARKGWHKNCYNQ